MSQPTVPMCDVLGQYRTIKPEIDAAVLGVLDSGMVINGPTVAAFEKEYAAYCEASYAVGCADGTTAILLALAALDIGPGDEVILPPFTFFATVGSIIRSGATPVFADIDPYTFNIDPNEIEKKITPRTKAIMPVHLFGQCAQMDAIWNLATDNNLYVIEDAAQSFGACYNRRKCGTLGIISCFSFYPSKNIGTFGDGGMCTTMDERLYKKLMALRNHGSDVKYYHKYVGWNARLDAIHAAILRVKLPYAEKWIAGRQAAARRYDVMIDSAKLGNLIERPIARPNGRHTFNQYTVRVAKGHRDSLMQHLKSENVSCDIYYPLPLHLQECCGYLGHSKGDFPVSEAAADSVLSLPIFPEITEAQQKRVIDAVTGYARQSVRMVA